MGSEDGKYQNAIGVMPSSLKDLKLRRRERFGNDHFDQSAGVI